MRMRCYCLDILCDAFWHPSLYCCSASPMVRPGHAIRRLGSVPRMGERRFKFGRRQPVRSSHPRVRKSFRRRAEGA
eukprot:3764318-Rhodomonas_salina.1